MSMKEQENRRSGWQQLKIVGILAVLAFAVTLAVIISDRLSDEAMAVLAGAVCGVGAAIPTSLIIVAVTQRNRRSGEPKQSLPQHERNSAYPPVVVVAPPGNGQKSGGWNSLPSSLQPPTQREFTIVGETSSRTGRRL